MLAGKKVLIFDLGGVLLNLYVERSFAALVELGAPAAMLNESSCLLNETMQRYDRGDISTADMLAYMQSFIPRPCSEDELRRIWNLMLGDFPPAKLQCLHHLRRQGYRVVMLSNTNDGHWGEIERKFEVAAGEPLAGCFDALYLSYRMRCRKPEPAIFEQLLAAEGVEPGETLFFDDSAENCEAARSLGIAAVRVGRNAPWSSLPLE